MKAFDNRLTDAQVASIRKLLDLNPVIACGWMGDGSHGKKRYKFFCAHVKDGLKVVADVTQDVCKILGHRMSQNSFMYSELSMLDVQIQLNLRLEYHFTMAEGYCAKLNHFVDMGKIRDDVLKMRFQITMM